MTNKIDNLINNLFKQIKINNIQIAMKYLEKQRNNPENVTEKDFMAHPNILETQNILLFFKDNTLKPDAKEIYSDFQEW